MVYSSTNWRCIWAHFLKIFCSIKNNFTNLNRHGYVWTIHADQQSDSICLSYRQVNQKQMALVRYRLLFVFTIRLLSVSQSKILKYKRGDYKFLQPSYYISNAAITKVTVAWELERFFIGWSILVFQE